MNNKSAAPRHRDKPVHPHHTATTTAPAIRSRSLLAPWRARLPGIPEIEQLAGHRVDLKRAAIWNRRRSSAHHQQVERMKRPAKPSQNGLLRVPVMSPRRSLQLPRGERRVCWSRPARLCDTGLTPTPVADPDDSSTPSTARDVAPVSSPMSRLVRVDRRHLDAETAPFAERLGRDDARALVVRRHAIQVNGKTSFSPATARADHLAEQVMLPGHGKGTTGGCSSMRAQRLQEQPPQSAS